MSQLAIGMIETVGLAAAIEAADVCVKSANVNLIGYELSRGNGMAVVKIEGNVGAVKAAIEAATIAANKVNKVFSTKVIPRPSDCIDFLIRNSDTIGYENIENVEISQQVKENHEDKYEDIIENKIEKVKEEIDNNFEISSNEKIDESQGLDEDNVVEEIEEHNLDNTKEKVEEKGYTCNLCKDPKCPRQKGDLKTTCIHYEENNN